MNIIQEKQDTGLYTTKSSSNLENCQSLDELLLEERNMLESSAYDTQPDKEEIDINIDSEETILKSTYNNSQKAERTTTRQPIRRINGKYSLMWIIITFQRD